MKSRLLTLAAAVLAIALTGAAVAAAHDYGHDYGDASAKPRTLHKPVHVRSAKLAKSAFLTGKAEIGKDGRPGAGDLDASGTAMFQIVDEKTICYGFTVDNTDAPTVVHIHKGVAGQNGAPVIAFANVPKDAQGQPAGDPGTSSGCKTLTTPEELAALKELRNPRGFYVNMHTAAFPNGAVRGQLSNLVFSNR